MMLVGSWWIVVTNSPLYLSLSDLVHKARDVAYEMGEAWRIEHAEFMDSLAAAADTLDNEATLELTQEKIVDGILNYLMSGDPDMPKVR